MKIKTKVRAGGRCGGGTTPTTVGDIQFSELGNSHSVPRHIQSTTRSFAMKIKSKVKAGGRCGGPIIGDIQSPFHRRVARQHVPIPHPCTPPACVPLQELPMKIKTKTKAGGRCNAIPDVQSNRANSSLFLHPRAVRSALSTRSFP